MLKHILAISLGLASFAFANNCKDWSNNSDNCLIDTVMEVPRFSNTEETFSVGARACRTYNDKYYTVGDSIVQKNGLVVRFKLPQRVCRDIVDISTIKIPHTVRVPRYTVNRTCCDNSWTQYSYRQECYRGELSTYCTKVSYIDSIYYTNKFQITYSDSADITHDYAIEKARIELDPDYFVEGDIIEIYREDGTIRYKGDLIFVPGDEENFPSYKTRGWCYNKTGTKEVRKTNNVSLCK